MKKLLKKIIALAIMTTTVLGINSIGANAEWKQVSNGLWWNSEGGSWSVGWRNIDGKWYYFGQDGYMKTGWVQEGNDWYYLNTDGTMATNLTTPDGSTIGNDGKLVKDNISSTNVQSDNTAQTTTQTDIDTNNTPTSSDEENTPDYTSIFYFKDNGNIDSVCQGRQTLEFYDQDISITKKTYGMLIIKNSDYGIQKSDLIKIIPNYKVENGDLIEK